MEETLINAAEKQVSSRVISTKSAGREKKSAAPDKDNEEIIEVPGKSSKPGSNGRTYLSDDDDTDEDDGGLEDEESWVEEGFLDDNSEPDDDFVPGESDEDLLLLDDDDDDED